MAIVLRNESSKINSNINVTPMVDVMLVLLIIFMVITPMLHPGVPVDLVKTFNPAAMSNADKADALILSVMRDGKMFLGSESVTSDALTQRVRDTVVNRVNKTVYVRADARARYGLLVDAVDDLRLAGVDQLGLLTEQRSSIRAEEGKRYSQKRLELEKRAAHYGDSMRAAHFLLGIIFRMP